MKLLIASHNHGKVEEFKRLLNQFGFDFLTLSDLEECSEPAEDGQTLWENALIKAKYYYDQYQIPVVCDDTGLFIDALGGEPGINAARFSGLGDQGNRNLVLERLANEHNRQAYFETALIFYDGHRLISSTGRVDGCITKAEKGTNGFGYDSIFMPDGFNKTMAELSGEEKNRCSHRYYAIKHLVFKLNFYFGIDNHQNYLTNLAKQIYPDCQLLSITPFPGGMSNNTYLLAFDLFKKVARLPGDCAEMFVDRNIEYNMLEMVNGRHEFLQYEYFDHEFGVKISPYIDSDEEYMSEFEMVKTLEAFHKLPKLANDYDPYKRLFYFERLCQFFGIQLDQEYYNNVAKLKSYQEFLSKRPMVSCHNDAQLSNWLFTKNGDVLIDLEFTGNNDPYYDYACFGNNDLAIGKNLLSMALNRPLNGCDETIIELWYAMQAISWYLVALFKAKTGLNELLNLDFDQIAHYFLTKATNLLTNK